MGSSDEAARLQHMIDTGQGSDDARRQAADHLRTLQQPAQVSAGDYDLETAGGTEAGGGPQGRW